MDLAKESNPPAWQLTTGDTKKEKKAHPNWSVKSLKRAAKLH